MKKTILGIAALTALGITSVFAAPATTAYQWGDVNCSGAVTGADVATIVTVAAGGSAAYCGMPFDLNCSGTVTSTDISIVSYIAGGGTYNKPAACG